MNSPGKKPQKISLLFIFINILFYCSLQAASSGIADEKIGIGGYLESRYFLLSNFRSGELTGSWTRLLTELRASPNQRLDIEIAIRGNQFSGFMIDNIIPSDSMGFDKINRERESLIVDRAFLAFNSGRTRYLVGKQVIQQGVAYIFRPLDIYNPVYMLEPGFDVYGISGLRAITSLGTVSELDMVLIPERKWKNSKATMRLQSNLAGADFGVSIINSGEDFFAGLDIRGDMGIGYWFETVSNAETDKVSGSLKYTLGFDYTVSLGNGIYLLSEYFHDNSGYNPTEYAAERLTALQEGRQFLGKNYLASMMSYPLSNRLNLIALGVTNLDDNSLITALQIEWKPIYNMSIVAGTYLNMSPIESEFAPLMPESLKYYQKASQFFIWLRGDF